MPMSEENRAKAAERMRRFQDAKRAIKNQTISSSSSVTATLEPQKPEEGFDIVLAFKVTREGPMHGLWQLYHIMQGLPQKIGAETTRLSVLNMARDMVSRYIA